MKCNSQRGVALVVTLIMLAIITVVAVIFLGIARRNRAGVSMQHEQTVAEIAAEAALQRAKMDIVGQIMSRKQMLGYDLAVSRGGDLWNTNIVNPTYTFPPRDPRGDSNGPVLVNTNYAGAAGVPDPRPHMDLNRTGEFEPSFFVTNSFTNAFGVFTNVVTVTGDPEWILIPDRPDRPYSPENRYVARMAYIAIPAGKAMDVNTAHNANSPVPPSGLTGNFMRNQGVGAWELNMAAMLHEIDTNIWDYSYGPFPTPLSSGAAFTNAKDFVFYRTNFPGKNPLTLDDTFPNGSGTALETDGVDSLSDDLVIAGAFFNDETAPATRDVLTKPFPGADALRHYFTHQDFFDATKTSPNFVNNLRSTLANPTTGPRTNGYKFYDILAQLATDTGTENKNRINLNWANLNGYTVDTLTAWDSVTNKDLPLIFFTNAAQRILESMAPDFLNWIVAVGTNYYTNSVTNVNHILISPANTYAGGVHRIMQQAANIFDASRTNEFPSVFRPLFGRRPTDPTTNLYIVGWTNDSSHSGLMNWLADNTNGIPAVIGAKKGLPNFNEYTFRTDILVERKLQLIRPAVGEVPTKTNQMYVMGLSNAVAVEAWNSYYTQFPHPSVIEVTNTISFVLSNIGGIQSQGTYVLGTAFAVPAWNGRDTQPERGFKLPLLTNMIVLSNSVYRFSNNRFENISTNQYEDSGLLTIPFGLPDWTLTISNHLVYIHRFGTNIVDFVVLRDSTDMDLSSTLASRALSPPSIVGSVWSTNRAFGAQGPTEGIRAQIQYSQTPGNTADWVSYSQFSAGANEQSLAARSFRDFLNGNTGTTTSTNTALVVQTPFNPIARLIRISTWQANDPLVHYHLQDLTNFAPTTVVDPVKWRETNIATIGSSSITNINRAYAPWGSEGGGTRSTDPNSMVFTLRDPGVKASDNWNFPTNKYPSVGWLGRVHRGTPWQTVYLKAGAAPLVDWRAHANSVAPVWQGLAVLNHPTNDLRLADIFTTALTDSSAIGLLSINQPRLPAWSAAFSGVVVLTNILDDDEVMNPFSQALPIQNRFGAIFIEPTHGDTNSPMWLLWNAIQAERIRQGGLFRDFSQLLAVPELTTESPFLHLSDNQRTEGIDDAAYERIPQQILGLLRVGQSRVVIYAYGQALKPERVNPSTRVVENYQITSEFATRTVLRIEGTAQNPRTVVESFNILPPD